MLSIDDSIHVNESSEHHRNNDSAVLCTTGDSETNQVISKLTDLDVNY